MTKRFGILHSIFWIGLVTLTNVLSSCDPSAIMGSKEEGEIEFETKGVDETDPLYGFMPSTASLKFKGDKFIIEMSTMGMFNTSIIGDSKEKTMAQTVKFLDIQQACIQTQKDLKEENDDYALKLEETKETKKIIGLKCRKVKATRIKDPKSTWDVWYTKELGMEHCNELTPYASIKGVLIDYRIKKMGMELHFKAKSYRNYQIPDNAFEIHAAMKIVSPEEMKNFFKKLQ